MRYVPEKGGCTLCGSSYPDMYWDSLITTLAEGHDAGLNIETFEKQIGKYN